jgi:uncharacterized protein YheU (UPF0270 family)
MLIPYQTLTESALNGIAKEYILQQLDGQYDPDFDLEHALGRVIKAVKRGDLIINFSEINESVTLTTTEDLQKQGLDIESFGLSDSDN